MTEREAYIAFNLLPGMGAMKVAKAAEAHGSVSAAWAAHDNKLDWQGKAVEWEREIARAEKLQVRLVTLADDDYPALLKEIASPPLVLYVAGDVAALSKPAVALVGTRHPTLYGQETAGRLAMGLAHAGWAVYSGLALGVDSAAHKGALAARGITAAVLGGALDKFYPKDNTRLAREIVDAGGAVASEFPFGRPPDAQTFPQRNRIVSGLSRGVVAVEAPIKSGTLITCHQAAEQGRSVMAVPGRIDSRHSLGCLHLIREGATMVTGVEDILEELGDGAAPAVARGLATGKKRKAPSSSPSSSSARAVKAKMPAAVPVKFSAEEAVVLAVLDEEAMPADMVSRKTGIPIGKLNALLVQLRLKRKVRLLPGNQVQLTTISPGTIGQSSRF